MCVFCDDKNKETIETEFSSLRVEIVGKTMEIGYDAYSCDSSFCTSINIEYCPMCGKKL